MAELGAVLPTKESKGSKLLDEGEDGAKGVLARREAARASGIAWSNGFVERAEEVGMGGVVLDQHEEQSEHPLQPPNVYREWQLRRQADTQTAPPPQQPPPSAPLLANMGLFARLPGEIRNRLYRLALLTPSSDEPFLITMQPATCSLGPCTHAKLPTAVPGLLSSCRQIRQEALPIFCAENKFKFDAKTVRERCTANWVRALGHYARLIPSVILEIYVWEDVSPSNHKKVGRTYEMMLDCPFGPISKSNDLNVNEPIYAKEPETCQKLFEHWASLAERGQEGEKMETLLVEFLWSDLMADLVWRCRK